MRPTVSQDGGLRCSLIVEEEATQVIVCASCEKENEDFFLFCISCGVTLDGVEETVFEPLPAEKADAVFEGTSTPEPQHTALVSDASGEHPHAAEGSENLPDAPSEELGIITFADFEASEPALTIPTSRPFNKALLKTVVTEVVFVEHTHPAPQESGSQSVKAEAHFSAIDAALDNADALDDVQLVPSSEKRDEVELRFLAPIEPNDITVASVTLEPLADLPLATEPDPTDPPLGNTLTESTSMLDRVLMDTQPDFPPSANEGTSAPSESHEADVPAIVPVDWANTVEHVSEQPEKARVVSHKEPLPESEPPLESPQTFKEPTKPKKRLHASKPKKRARSTGRRKRPGLCGKIVLLKQDGSDGDRFDLFTDSTWVGSNKGDINFGDDRCMAPKHAVLFYEDGTLRVRSLDKRNGVFLRLSDKISTPIQSGDQFRIGQELLQYKAADATKAKAKAKASNDGTVPLGSPLTEGTWGFLYQRLSETEHGNVFVLDQECVSMGRDAGDITFPDDGTVSGVHARLSHSDGTVFLQDVGSSNGTYLRLTGTTDLEVGDHLLIGEQILRIAN
jgi:pSer/pThr/pTyr-binding forkhead associated (FHA) protein